jgi:hypothetical protein
LTAFIPTTRVNVFRGDTTDEYGDPVNANTVPVLTSRPCALVESLQQTTNPSAGDEAFVETVTIRFRPGTDVREGDRAVDTATGYIYLVDTVSKPSRLAWLADVRCSATRLSTGDGSDS